MMRHFFDIGANTGQTFDWYLLKTNDYDGWHVWCFEPSAQNISALRKRCLEIVANNEHGYKITLCPFGLSDAIRWPRIHETVDTLGDSIPALTFVGDIQVEKLVSELDVRCAVCDAANFILENTNRDDEIVLKIDCEGSEFEILESLLYYPLTVLPRIKKILIEYHDPPRAERRDKILSRLDEANIPVEPWQL
jgi:FkbM family methyltransferase